jgi:hypothetical protein
MELSTERAHERHAVDVRVEVDGPGDSVLVGHTRNLSRGGLCVELADPLSAGSDVDVRIALIFEDEEKSEHLEVPMRVVWCRSTQEGHQIGGSFLALSAEQLEYLEVFVTFLEVLPWAAEDGETEAERPEV